MALPETKAESASTEVKMRSASPVTTFAWHVTVEPSDQHRHHRRHAHFVPGVKRSSPLYSSKWCPRSHQSSECCLPEQGRQMVIVLRGMELGYPGILHVYGHWTLATFWRLITTIVFIVFPCVSRCPRICMILKVKS